MGGEAGSVTNFILADTPGTVKSLSNSARFWSFPKALKNFRQARKRGILRNRKGITYDSCSDSKPGKSEFVSSQVLTSGLNHILDQRRCSMSIRTPGLHPSTFSIVARDPANGDLGVAVQSKFLAVGSVVPWARAGVGAVATQAWANSIYGPEGLRLMAAGWIAQEALNNVLALDHDTGQRQVLLVDAAGRAAAHTGEKCHQWAGHIVGDSYACAGNILVSQDTVQAMARAFEESRGALPERLIAA